MNRKSKSLCTLTSLALVTLLGFSQVSFNDGSAFADCAENVAFEQDLPLSHPINRCAVEQSKAVSWSSWFSGSSSSYQFHFIDLLELLSRSKDNNQPNANPAK